jgi:serine/threonine protein kinase
VSIFFRVRLFCPRHPRRPLMDKYKRIKTIGKGAFGEAVLVKSLKDDNLYVSKEINLAGLSKKDRDATDNEIRILATVDHPNITKYIESIQEDQALFIILEYADGGDLHDQIKRQQLANLQEGQIPFPEMQIRNWFVQICLAMQHLHSKKILHRDLKTRNVFLTKSGQVKLGDFGLSTVLKSTMAQANTLCGTPYYFSPELCRNKPYNSKSDVWALGCILYEMCTLRHAFDGKNMKMLMQKILKGVYPPISSSYSQDLANLIKLILVRDETKRPTVTQILEVPWMQTSLKILVHNLSQMTEEEEKENEQKRLTPTTHLIADASKNIQGGLRGLKGAEPVGGEDFLKQMQELKSLRNADPKAFKDFLKKPPPAEVAAEIQAVLKATSEQQLAQAVARPVSPSAPPASTTTSSVESALEALSVQPGGGAGGGAPAEDLRVLKLARGQFNTIHQQITKLMCAGDGQRCPAAAEEEDDPHHPHHAGTTVEELRRTLQLELGEKRFREAHGILRAVTDADDEEDIMRRLDAILGDKAFLRNMVTQLIAFEDEAAALGHR